MNVKKDLKRAFLWAGFLACIFFSVSWHACADELDHAKKERETITEKITTLQQNIADEEKRMLLYQEELKKHEVKISKITKEISGLSIDLVDKQSELDGLKVAYKNAQIASQAQLEQLSNDLQTLLLLGKHTQLKIMLNLENPAALSRSLQYLKAIQQSRHAQIEQLQQQLDKTAQLKHTIEEQTHVIEVALASQQSLLKQVKNEEASRKQWVATIQQTLVRHNTQLDDMIENEKTLSKTIHALEQKRKQEPVTQSKHGSFLAQKGKLTLPVMGKLQSDFGDKKTKLKSQGIFVSAPTGSNVKAVYSGKIIYADWLRGYGLLVIIDHGNDYLSLYAHNQHLLKEKGDWVMANETIAQVGNSGGLAETGLYFEIRYKGQPINPSPWLTS